MAERAANLELLHDFSLSIDGEPVSGGEIMEVIDPATEEVFAVCPAAGRGHLERAVTAARRALGDWSERSREERAELIRRYSVVLRERKDELGALLTREQGKPIGQSVAEFERGTAQADGMAGIGIPVEVLIDDDKRRIELHYRPLGVVGIITPWNAPAALALGALSAALYTGNTVILKPSPYTPLTTLKMGELAQSVFPPGVVNVLSAGNDLGQWMTEHPDIDKISFTGSVATGKKVMASSAETLKRVTLELGGNDPAIVLDDADPRAIAKSLFFACFVNSGQVCMAVKRIYAHESVYDELCAALVEQAEGAKVGNGLEADTRLGPLQNRMQFDKVSEIIEDTKKSGATILTGGGIPDRPGYFIEPTLVTDVDDDSRLVREEQFGPVVPILKFSDPEDALRRANDTRYGLSGSVWTADPERGKALAQRMEVGTAWVNQHRAVSAHVPFGGAKQSGLGRQYSILGLKGYMEPQVVSVSKI